VVGVPGDRGRTGDEVDVVGAILQVDDLVVLLDRVSDARPLGPLARGGQGAQVGRVEAAGDRSGHEGLQLGGQPAGAERLAQGLGPRERLVPAQEVGHDGVARRRGHELGRRGERLGVAELSHEGVAERVEGHRRDGGRRARQPASDPVAQLAGGLAAEGQDEDLVGRQLAGLDPVDDDLDERGGLARARAGEHEQRPATVVDDGLLRLVQRGGRGAHGVWALQDELGHGPHGTSLLRQNRWQ